VHPKPSSSFPILFLLAAAVCLAAGPSAALPTFGDQVDQFCTSSGGTPATPFAGNCAICHNPASSSQDRTEGFNRFLQGDLAYFCPVAQANQPPVLDPIGGRSVSEDGMLAIHVTASDPDGGPLALEASGLPTGAVFVDNRNGTGDFAWMPGFDQAGNHSVTFRVTDAGSPPASDSETITISVGNVNRPPVLAPIGNRSALPGELLAFDLSASDPDGDRVSFSSAGLPATAELSDHGDGSASFRWTPAAGDAGNVAVTFSVTDTGVPMQGDSEQVVISVGMGQNRPPVLAPIGDRSLAPGETLQILLTATDPDADSIDFACDGLPASAELLDHRDGSAELTWQPAADQLGNFAIECRASDTGTPSASDSESFTVSVGSVNRPPVLAPVTLMMDGETFVMPLTASDPDGDALQFAAEGAPSGSDLMDNGDGTGELSYTPEPGTSGSFDVRFVVTDDGTPPESDSQLFSLVVGEPAAAALEIRAAVWRDRRGLLRVSGQGAEARASVELRDAASGSVLGTTTADRRGRFQFRLQMSGDLAPCAIEAVSGSGSSGPVDLTRAPSRCASGGGVAASPSRSSGATSSPPGDASEDEPEMEAPESEEGSSFRGVQRSWLRGGDDD
jgi:hypothetical protein